MPFSEASVLKGISDQIWPQDDVHGVSSAIFYTKGNNVVIGHF
jgi:hypothetical protein